MLPYTAYLRVYEPLSAFSEAEGRRWAAYAASADRPRRANALAAEHADSLRRMIATPPIAAPPCESGDAYVRWADGVTYICPWQTRLRSLLALARLRATAPSLLAAAFPAGQVEAAVADFARWQAHTPALRLYIQASTWSVPCAWFVPFAPDERWLVLGAPTEAGEGGRATAAATRALVYATTMAQARKRVARALATIRRVPGGPAGSPAADEAVQVLTAVEDVGRWLEEFHPHALVELDYGGLVHLVNDAALQADQSVAEVSAAISALATGEQELAIAMYRRLTRRWRALEARESAS